VKSSRLYERSARPPASDRMRRVPRLTPDARQCIRRHTEANRKTGSWLSRALSWVGHADSRRRCPYQLQRRTVDTVLRAYRTLGISILIQSSDTSLLEVLDNDVASCGQTREPVLKFDREITSQPLLAQPFLECRCWSYESNQKVKVQARSRTAACNTEYRDLYAESTSHRTIFWEHR
jgi:hypothetical protein